MLVKVSSTRVGRVVGRRGTGLGGAASLGAVLLAGVVHPAAAGPAFSCGGFAMAGGAELFCSHVDPKAPAQSCSWSWTLLTTANAPSVVNGSFLLVPGVQNDMVYEGFGFNAPLSPPVVLCQGRKDPGAR